MRFIFAAIGEGRVGREIFTSRLILFAGVIGADVSARVAPCQGYEPGKLCRFCVPRFQTFWQSTPQQSQKRKVLFQNRPHSFPLLRVSAKAGHLLEYMLPGLLHHDRSNIKLGVSVRSFSVCITVLHLDEVRFYVGQFCHWITTLRRLGRFLLNGRFCPGLGVLDLLQDGVVFLWPGLG